MRIPLNLIECVSAALDLENQRNVQRVAHIPFFISKDVALCKRPGEIYAEVLGQAR
jgi:hypothetical protein